MTTAMLLPPKHQQCPADILIRCCDATLSMVNEYKYLGVIIDSTLSWEAHVDSVVSKVAKKIGTLRRAGNSLTQAARRQYYLSVIQSDLQYGTNAYWTTLTNARQNRLIRSSKRRLCEQSINAPTTTPTKTILSLLNLSPLETRLKLKLLVHTFRCIHNKASSLLCAQYQVRSPTHSTHRTTRAQTYTSLIIPRVSKSAGEKAQHFLAPYCGMSFLAIFALFLLYIHFGKSLWFTWIPCNEASACRVSIIKQQTTTTMTTLFKVENNSLELTRIFRIYLLTQ